MSSVHLPFSVPGSARRGGVIAIIAVLFAALVGVLVVSGVLSPARLGLGEPQTGASIEPRAGTWKTWLVSSGSQLRIAAPPDAAATRAEIAQLKTLASQRDQAAQEQIAYWNVGAPAFRWNEIAVNEGLKHNLNYNRASRILALMNAAIYDATITAWDSKYAYNRPRPGVADSTLSTAVPNPASPSYPSEHAVAAGAAAAVLAYAFPDDSQAILAQADADGQSRVLAGVQYPSDVQAGLALGKQVGALAVERAKHDGSDAVWTGTVPAGPGHWIGTDPSEPMMGTWQPWVLSSGHEVRPGPPPAYDSPQEKAELAELKNFARTPRTNNVAFFWQYAAGGGYGYQFWFEQTSRKIAQTGLDDNPPRAARAYALQTIAFYDALIACWDAKYAYWAIRPYQLDPDLKPLYPPPGHPSYPEGLVSVAAANATILGYLFPGDAQTFAAMAKEAGESRIWSGIHFRSDLTAGEAIGRAVGQKVIARAQADGSQ